MNPAVLGVYGESGSGKTTLVVEIIKRLTSEGFKVASVKISDKKIYIDTKEKDTWKHAKAGSKLVVFSSESETDFLIKQRKSFREVLDCVERLGNHDIILVEGANDEFTPKIRIGKIKERKNTILTYDGDFEGTIGLIKNEFLRRN